MRARVLNYVPATTRVLRTQLRLCLSDLFPDFRRSDTRHERHAPLAGDLRQLLESATDGLPTRSRF